MAGGEEDGREVRHVCELCGEGGMGEGDLRTHILLVHVEGLATPPQVQIIAEKRLHTKFSLFSSRDLLGKVKFSYNCVKFAFEGYSNFI